MTNNINTRPVPYKVWFRDNPKINRIVDAMSAYQARRLFAEQSRVAISATAAEIVLLPTKSDIIEVMKAEAVALNGEYVAWRDRGDYLINCRMRGDGYEWRKVTASGSLGVIISESTARRLLQKD